MLAAIVLLILFLLIASQTRGIILSALANVADRIERLPPLSQALVAVLLLASAIGILLMARWSKSGKSPAPRGNLR